VHLIQIPATADQSGVSPLEKLWPVVAPLLEKAVELSGGVTTLAEEYQALINLKKQLWAIITEDGGAKTISAAGITSLQKFPSGLQVANIEMLGGENMKAWFSLKEKFEEWAKKDEGCTKVRLYARKAWARNLPDYKLAAYVMEKPL
jgi:hypothetical protein